jgi:uncharacterized coiled-coil protein SlyX
MFDAFHSVGGEIIFLGAVVGGLGVVTALLWKAIKLIAKLAAKLDLIDEIPNLQQDIKTIKGEVTTNGGKSLKDELNRSITETEKYRKNFSAKLRVVDARMKKIEENTRVK